MSKSFRPVKEIWNVHSSCFIESEKSNSIVLLHDLAARIGTASDEHLRIAHYRRNCVSPIIDGFPKGGDVESNCFS